MFTKFFDYYVCVGDAISVDIDGFVVTATLHSDHTHIDDDDSHNLDQSVTGCDDVQQAKLLAARKAWLAGEWFYCAVILSVSKRGVVLSDYAASLWSIEANYPGSDNSYLTEVANELLPKAITEAKRILKTLCS